MSNGKPIIAIRNVYKRFGSSVVAVDNADFEVREGDEIGRASCRERV